MPRRRRSLFAHARRRRLGAASAAPSPAAAVVVHRAASFGVETLERRTLLTQIGIQLDALGNPMLSGTGTVIPVLDGTFEFVQGNPKQIVRVAWHDIRAELIGVLVDATATNPGFDTPVVTSL